MPLPLFEGRTGFSIKAQYPLTSKRAQCLAKTLLTAHDTDRPIIATDRQLVNLCAGNALKITIPIQHN